VVIHESLVSSASGRDGSILPLENPTNSIETNLSENDKVKRKISPPTNTIYDSYNLNINDVLPILLLKATVKLETAVSANQSKQLFQKSTIISNQPATDAIRRSHNDSGIKMMLEKNTKNAALATKSNILDKLKTAHDDSMNADMISLLSKKQKTFITDVKNAQLKPIAMLNEEVAREIHKIKEPEDFNLQENLKKNVIMAPNNDEPVIDLTSLLKANQTDAQFMVSQVKERNRNFLNTILDD
jgi:hypothetical protein